jgi:hypothetical protein
VTKQKKIKEDGQMRLPTAAVLPVTQYALVSADGVIR